MSMGGSPGYVSEEPVTQEKRKKGLRMNCDVCKATSLHLRHSSFSNPSVASPTSQLILQPFRCFTYVTDHSPTFLSLLLHHRLLTYVTWRVANVQEVRRINQTRMNFEPELQRQSMTVVNSTYVTKIIKNNSNTICNLQILNPLYLQRITFFPLPILLYLF